MLTLAATLWLAGGCGDDSFDLGKTGSSSGAGQGGSGSSGGAQSSSSAQSGGGGMAIVEPPGATTFTLVHGVVDQPQLRFCLTAYPAGPSDEQPWPGVAGLAFGGAFVEADVSQLIAADEDMQLWGFAGDLAATQGADCALLINQTPANVQKWSFGILPASVFEQDKDLLLVANGCMGGEGHTDPQEKSYCGASYSPQTPNATLIAGFMSRLGDAGKIPMQFVQGSQAALSMRLLVRAGQDASTALLVKNGWTWGSYAPYPPFANFSDVSIGNVGNARIELNSTSGAQAVAQVPFAIPFALAGLPIEEVSNGQGLVFVAIGAGPQLASGSWWQNFTFTVVKADPGAGS